MSAHRLVLTQGGSAELYKGKALVWNSADDESFRDEFEDEFLTEADIEGILDYLVEEDFLTDDEADNLDDIEEESLNGDAVVNVPADTEEDE